MNLISPSSGVCLSSVSFSRSFVEWHSQCSPLSMVRCSMWVLILLFLYYSILLSLSQLDQMRINWMELEWMQSTSLSLVRSPPLPSQSIFSLQDAPLSSQLSSLVISSEELVNSSREEWESLFSPTSSHRYLSIDPMSTVIKIFFSGRRIFRSNRAFARSSHNETCIWCTQYQSGEQEEERDQRSMIVSIQAIDQRLADVLQAASSIIAAIIIAFTYGPLMAPIGILTAGVSNHSLSLLSQWDE